MTSKITPATAALLQQRSDGICEVCGAARATNIHHRTPRGMGGTNRAIHTVEWLLHLCGSGTQGCHGYIESHPEVAYSKGWKLRRLDTPARPVQYRQEWVVLGPDGTVSPHRWTPSG